MNLIRRTFLYLQSSVLWAASYKSDDTDVILESPVNVKDGVRPESVGGQAVIEGVMMRSSRRLAVAVRSPEGEIVIDNREFIPYARRHWLLSWPVLRGACSLVESLAMGLRALNFSISVQERNANTSQASFAEPASAKDKWLIAGSLAVSFLFAMALFQFLPYAIAGYLTGGTRENPVSPFLFNGTAGAVRMSLLLVYLYSISKLPDVARVFQYHGAEHKSIFAHEHTRELTVENAAKESRFHPRCGTSFILIVGLVCIAFFSLLDTAILSTGYRFPNFIVRFLIHLPFIPMVAGLAFEVLKFSAKWQDSIVVKPLVAPGLWLQRITTREPDPKQLQVAITSIHAALA